MVDHFAEKAQEWDGNPVIQALSSTVSAAIKEKVDFQPTMRVMDFGAGTGLITSSIVPLVDKVVAVDTSKAMLDKLAAKPALKGHVEVACHDITQSPLDDSFDAIVSAMAMHHVQDTAGLMRAFAKHLKPGGQVALADLDHEDGSFHPAEAEGVFHSGFERDALQGVMEANGFRDVVFSTAHQVEKNEQTYPVFIVTAQKS